MIMVLLNSCSFVIVLLVGVIIIIIVIRLKDTHIVGQQIEEFDCAYVKKTIETLVFFQAQECGCCTPDTCMVRVKQRIIEKIYVL